MPHTLTRRHRKRIVPANIHMLNLTYLRWKCPENHALTWPYFRHILRKCRRSLSPALSSKRNAACGGGGEQISNFRPAKLAVFMTAQSDLASIPDAPRTFREQVPFSQPRGYPAPEELCECWARNG